MTTKAKSTIFFSTFLVMLGVLLLSSCGYHYKCGVTFGSSTCSSSGSGIGTTGSSSGNTAFAYSIAIAGSVQGSELTGSNGSSLQLIPNFTSPTVPASDESAEIVVVPKKFVYAAFPSSQKLFAWKVDATTGGMVTVSGSPFSITGLGSMILNTTGVNFSSMAVNPSGTLLFLAYSSFAQVDVYQISTTGTLTQVPGAPFSTGTLQPYNLSFDGLGKYLYVTTGPEGLGGRVAAYAIGSSGALTAVTGSPFSFNMWQLQGEPSGKYMIGISGRSNAVTGLTDDDSLYVFNIQQSGSTAGALTQVSGSPFATVAAPINLAVQPVASNGSFVYSFSVSSEPNPIEGYQLDTNTGTLSAMTGSPFSNLGAGYWGQFDQSGAYLFIFANTPSTSSLGILSVASGTGVLTEPLGPVTLAPTTYFAITDAP